MSEIPYRSAYGGLIFSPNGTFDRFEVNVRREHARTGYWRFTSENDGEDDVRAYNQGYHSPEQILLAACNDDDGQYEGISLTWQPGEIDTFQVARTGSAKQHVQTIIEERLYLRQSVSFQGRVPSYVCDDEGKLLDIRQRNLPGKRPSGGASGTTGTTNTTGTNQSETHLRPNSAPTASPKDERRGSKSLPSPPFFEVVDPQTANGRPLATKSNLNPKPVVEFEHSVNANIRVAPSRTDSTTGQAGSGAAIPLQGKFASQPRASDDHTQLFSVHNRSHEIASGRPNKATPVSSTSTYEESAWGKGVQTRRLTPSLRISQEYKSSGAHQPPHTSPQVSASLPLGGSPRLPNEAMPVISEFKSVDPNQPGASRTPMSARTGSIHAAHSQERSDSDAEKEPTASSSQHTAARLTNSSNSYETQVTHPDTIKGPLVSNNLANTSGDTQLSPGHVPAPIVHGSPSKTGSLPVPEKSNSKPALHIQSEVRAPHIQELQSSGSALRTSDVSSHSTVQVASKYLGTERSIPSSKVSVSLSEYDPNDPFITDMLPLREELPCMDCGAISELAHDCHLANLLPSEEPNVLQLRELAEMTERFDPERWREHHVQPPSPPGTETTSDMIRGYASIVRNEESYKNDPDLHQLPDEQMLLLWALKTSKNTTVLLAYPNGDFQVPPGFEHLWDDEHEGHDEQDGGGHSEGV